MSKNILDELEASLESGETNFDIAITNGKPVDGLLESREGILKAFGDGPIDYGVTDAEIAALKTRTQSLTVSDEKAIEAGHKRAKAIRITIDNKRKEHKEVAIQYGRRVDGGAKVLLALIAPVEDRLKALRDEAEEIKATRQRLFEEAKRQLRDSRLSQLKDLEWAANPFAVAEMTDEEFDEELSKASEYFSVIRAKREADAEKKRIEEESRQKHLQAEREQAERDREELEALRAERKAQEERAKTLAEEVAEKQKAEQLESERKLREAIAEEKERYEREQAILREEFAKQQAEENRIRAEVEAKAKLLQAENDRLERERFMQEEEERLEKEAELQKEIEAVQKREQAEREAKAAEDQKACLEALKPDAEKINAFGKALFTWVATNLPVCKTDEGQAKVQNLDDALIAVCDMCIDFGKIRNESFPF